jgi:hypothetical protein
MTRSTDYRARIAEAAEWRLIGLLLERPRGSWHAETATLGGEVADRELRAVVAATSAAKEGDYLHVLGPGGLVSPREVTYQPFADPGQLLAQLATCYDAFAFRPHVEEPLDHIAVEVAFVSYLLLKEAFARARGATPASATTAHARRSFVERHLAPFAATFVQRLESAGPSYLLPIARCLVTRVPAHSPRALRVPADDPQDVCGACGIEEA